MDDLSSELRSRREALGLSLDDIYRRTRINPDLILALEEGRFHVLPDTYIRLFLKKYCHEIKLDAGEAVLAYERIAGRTGETPPVPASPHPVRFTLARESGSPTRLVAALGVAVVIVAGGAWWYAGGNPPDPRLRARPSVGRFVVDPPAVEPAPEPSSPVVPALDPSPGAPSRGAPQDTTGPATERPLLASRPHAAGGEPIPDAPGTPTPPALAPSTGPATALSPAAGSLSAAPAPTTASDPPLEVRGAPSSPSTETAAATPAATSASEPPSAAEPARLPETLLEEHPPADGPSEDLQAGAGGAGDSAVGGVSFDAAAAPSPPGGEDSSERVIAAFSLTPDAIFAPDDSVITLTVRGLESTQAMVTGDGDLMFSGPIQAGRRTSWRARDRFLFEAGSGAALEIALQGTPLRPLGRAGEKIRLFISRSSIWVEEIRSTTGNASAR